MKHQLKEIDAQVEKALIKSLKSLPAVVNVISIGSQQFVSQEKHDNSDFDFVLVTKDTLSKQEVKDLKYCLAYLFKKFSYYFRHNFVIVPHNLLKYFLQYHIYQSKSLYKEKVTKSNKYYYLQRLEWVVQDYLIIRRLWDLGLANYSIKKLYARMKRYLEVLESPLRDQFNMTTFALSSEAVPTKADIFSIKKAVENHIARFLNENNITPQTRFKLVINKEEYGYIFFVPFAWLGPLETVLMPFGKWPLRVMDNRIEAFLRLLLDSRYHRYLSPPLRAKKKFYRQWTSYLLKYDLTDVATFPIPYKLTVKGWRTILSR